MSPDSVETRLREAEKGLVRLEQQLRDLIAQMTRQFEDFDGDIRRLAPGIADSLRLIADIRSEMREIRKDVELLRADVEANTIQVGEIKWLKEQVLEGKRYRETREERERLAAIERRKDRKEDRRFAMQIAVAVCAVIVTALGVLGALGVF